MTFPRTKSDQNANYLEWPDVEGSFVPEERRERFEVLRAALKMYLGGSTPHEVFNVYGVRRQELYYYLIRCRTLHPDGRVMGYRALIGHAKLKGYVRQCGQSTATDGRGCSGNFIKLLKDHPKIVRIIRAAVGGKTGHSAKAAGLHVKTVHQEILRELRKSGVLEHQYPFNTVSGGYGALCRYVKQLLNRGDTAAVRARFGDTAVDAQIAGTGKDGWLQARAPLDLVCYDEQALPFIGVLKTYVGDEPIDIPLQRCSLCLIVDEYSNAVLGYFVSTRRRVCAGDVLSAVEHLLTPWTPKKLSINDLTYREGAGFPSGLVEGFLGRRICLLKIDNDITHYANSVVSYMVEKIGCTIQFGQIGRWITRMPVERAFAEFQKRHFRQLPSTTGSGPTDPAVNDPVGKAIRRQIEWHELEEIIEVALANYNATPKPALFNKTPLEHLRRHFSQTGRGTVIPTLNTRFMEKPRLPTDVLTCVIRGSQKNGRRPYVELDRVHYTSDLLCNSWGMIGKKLKILVHGDFRFLRTYRENGEEFSLLNAIGHWGKSPHSRSQRIEINRLHREGSLKFDSYEDPVSVYQKFLAHKARERGRKGKISRESNRLLETLRPEEKKEYRSIAIEADIDRKPDRTMSNGVPRPEAPKWRQIFAKTPGEMS